MKLKIELKKDTKITNIRVGIWDTISQLIMESKNTPFPIYSTFSKRKRSILMKEVKSELLQDLEKDFLDSGLGLKEFLTHPDTKWKIRVKLRKSNSDNSKLKKNQV